MPESTPLSNLPEPHDGTTAAVPPIGPSAPSKKRRNHRAGRKKKNRRQSFAVTEELGDNENAIHANHDSLAHSATTRPPFYRLGQSGGRAMSESSMDSEAALLDHR